MENQPEKNLKLFYSIGEVAKMFNVPDTLLRYWEKVFPSIKPRKAGRNIRQYTQEDIENIRIIYHLVKEKGMTLAGAKEALKKNKKGTVQTAEVIARLKSIREELVNMRKELEYVN
ncbi:MAG: MerR family transcriptional regulator [Bacteroidaceae bacterium]|nr:MerR family transcriptional regulator [Bacteroidaceae bacterium]